MAIEEQQIERMARELGARAADRVDAEQTARAVLRRIKQAPRPAVWWRRAPVLQALAAAAVVVLLAGVFLVGPFTGDGGDAPEPLAIAELQELSTDELSEVFDSLVVEAPVAEYSSVGLQDLNEQQLRELLELMEG
jgi:anti-sigma factor RsiW